MAQLSCYNWQGKEARALSRERTGRHGCTGRGRDPPTTPEFHQVRTSTPPNPTVKLVRKCMCSRPKRAEGIQTRPQPDTSGWKFPNGQLASPQSRLGGFHEERRLQQAPPPHTQSWAPQSIDGLHSEPPKKKSFQGHLARSTWIRLRCKQKSQKVNQTT